MGEQQHEGPATIDVDSSTSARSSRLVDSATSPPLRLTVVEVVDDEGVEHERTATEVTSSGPTHVMERQAKEPRTDDY